jgi:hypothetical protein
MLTVAESWERTWWMTRERLKSKSKREREDFMFTGSSYSEDEENGQECENEGSRGYRYASLMRILDGSCLSQVSDLGSGGFLRLYSFDMNGCAAPWRCTATPPGKRKEVQTPPDSCERLWQ